MHPATNLTTDDLHHLRRSLYERSLYDFVRAAWPQIETAVLKDGWHLRALCDHLQAVTEGRITRLAISIPPGFLKSLMVAVFWPCWEWTRDPSQSYLVAGSSLEFCKRDNKRARDLLTSAWYQSYWPIRFEDDQNQVLKYQNTRRGFRWAMPWSKMTGARAGRILIDDIISASKSTSDHLRTEANKIFFNTVTSRIGGENTPIIIVMQRLHEEDLIGAILDRDIGFESLSIPMEWAGDSTPTSIGWRDPRTEIGELILPAYRSRKWVDNERKTMDPFAWSSQYQQNPVPDTDGFFQARWFQDRYQPADKPAALNIYMSSDHAMTEGSGDYTVIRVWGVDHRGHTWMLDSYRDRAESYRAMGIAIDATGRMTIGETGALALVKKWKPIAWFVEHDNTWRNMAGVVEKAMLATRTFTTIETMSLAGAGDKRAKAVAFRSYASLGMVHLPAGPIGDDAVVEYVKFPAGRHDDQVDADATFHRALMDTHPAILPIISASHNPADLDRETFDQMAGEEAWW